MRRCMCLFLCLAFLTSCAMKVSSIKEDVDLDLSEDSGYLLLGVDTNVTLQNVDIFGADNIRLSQNDLRPGSKFILIDLEAGDYSIRNIRFNVFMKSKLTDGYWDFTVLPGGVSYVGHLEVHSNFRFWTLSQDSTIELSNRSSEALMFMQQQFPNILTSRSLEYAGPGKDDFLKRMQQLDVTLQESQND